MVGAVCVIFSSFSDAEATFMFIRSWLLTVCGDFAQTGGQLSMKRMSLTAASLLNKIRAVVAFLFVLMIPSTHT